MQFKPSARATYWAHSSKTKFHYMYDNEGVGKLRILSEIENTANNFDLTSAEQTAHI